MSGFKTLICAALAVFVAGTGTASAQNLLSNGGFDAPPARANGNVYYAANTGNMAGWSIEGGGSANIPQVDGAGGFTYSAGPEQDASGAAAGQPQRYLDFSTGTKSVYQSFKAPCTATYRFGASFADRERKGGSGRTMIVAGVGPLGTQMASSPVVVVAAGATGPYVWHPSSGTVTLTAGQTYAFKIVMDDTYMNADSAFVQKAGECAAQTVDVPGDHFQCYRVVKGDALPPEKIQVEDQFGAAQLVLAKPVMLCNPSTKVHADRRYGVRNPELHLVCYAPLKQSDKPRERQVRIGNQFEIGNLALLERTMFCVPSQKKMISKP
jgi:hypothetical protein